MGASSDDTEKVCGAPSHDPTPVRATYINEPNSLTEKWGRFETYYTMIAKASVSQIVSLGLSLQVGTMGAPYRPDRAFSPSMNAPEEQA